VAEQPAADGRHRWIVDPLDGTTNYAHSYPCFCVSIALEHAGVLEIGVIYDPVRNDLFTASRPANIVGSLRIAVPSTHAGGLAARWARVARKPLRGRRSGAD